MKPVRPSLSVRGPQENFRVRKKPFGLRYRSPALSPFGLSLSKPSACGTKAPFDKLRAIGNTSSASPSTGSGRTERRIPFGLSLSKPSARGTKASASSAWPFDKLRANGGGERTVINSRNGPKAEACFMRRGSRATWGSN
jgi:hypothetical protein